MLSDVFKQQYQQMILSSATVLMKNPQLSMAQRLKDITALSEQYPETDVYGKGELVETFEKEVAQLLGQQSALFLPSGTMAQPMALRIWSDAKKCPHVAFHPTSHLQLHEQQGYHFLHQLKAQLIGATEKVITVNDLLTVKLPLAALLIELPMREIGGQLPTWNDLLAQKQWTKQNNVAFHLDGARLWSCTEYYQKSLAEIAGLFDSVYVSFYKDLDGISGAILAGSDEFIAQARVWARRYGGNLITLFPELLAAKKGLATHLPNMNNFVRKAAKIAAYFNATNTCQTIPQIPVTNMFHLEIKQADDILMEKVLQWSLENNVALLPLPRACSEDTCRFELSINTNALKLTDQQWQQFISSFSQFISSH